MLKSEEAITRYKIQVKCALTCYRTGEINKFIEKIINDEIEKFR